MQLSVLAIRLSWQRHKGSLHHSSTRDIDRIDRSQTSQTACAIAKATIWFRKDDSIRPCVSSSC